jgi:bifunctional UDP-N-acetylglucosamine pyrophosphorylase/glucosamine-1-phosphate N-acetyltransferase
MYRQFDVIILAGGKGSRMNSNFLKPLCTVKGVPTIQRILASVSPLCKRPIVVVGDHASEIMAFAGKNCRYVLQKEQRGTGHAVRCVKESIAENFLKKNIAILPGDHPLIDTQTIHEFFKTHFGSRAVATLCTLTVPNFKNENLMFFDYGRIRRDTRGRIASIVEVKDATREEKKIREVNVGYYCFKTDWLWKNLDGLTNRNAAGEFYLTDLLRAAIAQNVRTTIYTLKDPERGMGFNTRKQLKIIRKLCH